MELILISHPDFFKGETQFVSSLLHRFDFTFHLRKPDAGVDELNLFLREIPNQLHHKIVVSNSIEVFTNFKMKGMHFSTSKRTKRIHLSEKIYKGTSCHSVDEIKQLDSYYDYVYLSPIFPSISKQGYSGNLNLHEVSDYLGEERQTKVIALGGIDANKISILENFAFDAYAVLGYVWTNDPLKNIHEIESNFLKIYSQINKKQ